MLYLFCQLGVNKASGHRIDVVLSSIFLMWALHVPLNEHTLCYTLLSVAVVVAWHLLLLLPKCFNFVFSKRTFAKICLQLTIN